MPSRVEQPGQQAVWLDNDVDEDDAFDDPAWDAIDPGPVLGREQAAQWLVRREQRLEAARMRLTGSTQARPPVVHAPERREPVASAKTVATRPRERRARRSGSSRGGPSSESDPPPPRPPLTRAERDYLRGKIDARRREIVAASERAERSLEREWRRESAA
jgi:hypothetical protein